MAQRGVRRRGAVRSGRGGDHPARRAAGPDRPARGDAVGTALERLRAFARRLRADLLALSLAARDPRTPWLARALALLVLAYALSPIDLIPDFIPVLGQLDDLLLVPAGLWLALRLVPPAVLEDARAEAARHPARLARSGWGLALMLGLYASGVWGLWLLWARG